MCDYSTYLVGRWEMDNNPMVASRGKGVAVQLLGPADWVDPLADCWGRAPGTVLGAHPALDGDGGGGWTGPPR